MLSIVSTYVTQATARRTVGNTLPCDVTKQNCSDILLSKLYAHCTQPKNGHVDSVLEFLFCLKINRYDSNTYISIRVEGSK